MKDADNDAPSRYVEIDAIEMGANLGVPVEHDILAINEYPPLAHRIGIGFGVSALTTGVHSVRPEYRGDVARVRNARKNGHRMVV